MAPPDNDADATRSQAPVLAGAIATAPIVPGDTFVDDPERYAVEGRIGAGGMGTVVAARGSRLGRPVALKIVTAAREDLRRRFEREAQITARLQHPAIVPVYGAGRGRDGHPFYAMKHVSGEPLDQVVGKAATLADRIALLPNVIAVSEAIAYAHAERVIHRDLKPANILVGAFGETVVIDWGLAKDLAATADDDDEVTASPPQASGDETAYGKVMGTPAYMPVEQARGERVDERADVYALGAILYHVLAGRSPFVRDGETGVTWENMLARVLSAPPAPLATLQPAVPVDLLAVVARAMATDAAARYPSAGALAEDLKRFQTGQLVGAHDYSSWQLLRRWLRRYRTAVVVAGVAAVVLATASTVMVARIVRERDAAEVARTEAETQRGVAETQRRRADEQRDGAEHLVGFMLSDLKPQLDRVGRLDIMRGVAKNVDDYYGRLDQTASGLDARAVDQRAVALRVLGDVLIDQGDSAAATRAYRAAIALETGSRRDGAVVPAARAQIELGAALIDQGDLDVAAVAVDHGRAALEALSPRSPEAEVALATAYRRLGIIAFQRGHHDDAIAPLARCAEHARVALAAAGPHDFTAKKELAKCLDRTSDVDSARNDRVAAERDARASLALREEIIRDDPGDLEARFGAEVSWDKLYVLAVQASQPAQAKVASDTGIAIAESLVQREPDNAQWARALANAYLRRADMASSADQPGVAARVTGQAVAIAETLVARAPRDADRLADLADYLGKQGSYLADAHQLDAALASLRRALALAEQASAIAPANTQYRASVATVHEYLGDTLKLRGDFAGAATEYRARLAIDLALLHDAPDDVHLALNASATRFWLGDALAQQPAHRDEGIAAMATALEALHAMKAAGQLSPDFASTLPELEAELAKAKR